MGRHTLLPCAIALVLVPQLSAAQIPDDVARVEVLSGWRGEDGIHRGAISIELAPGWKTYWRAAGEGGIPPSFNWMGSSNLDALDVHFPVPQVFDQNGLRSYGYESGVVFPFHARPNTDGEDIRLSGTIEIGVCLDVCIPVSIEISDILPPNGVDGRSGIQAALSDRPMTQSEAGVGDMTCRIEPISDGLRVSTQIDMGQMPGEFAAVMELPDRTIWISEADVVQEGSVLSATAEMVPQNGQPFFLARDSLRVTLIGANEAVEIVGCG